MRSSAHGLSTRVAALLHATGARTATGPVHPAWTLHSELQAVGDTQCYQYHVSPRLHVKV